jgi:hypothetical protein
MEVSVVRELNKKRKRRNSLCFCFIFQFFVVGVDDPGNQEELTSPLHYAELVCVLGLLSIGGSTVLKMFTLFEYSTACILYLCNCLFESVSVFKPATR